jgi:hypothetical protein
MPLHLRHHDAALHGDLMAVLYVRHWDAVKQIGVKVEGCHGACVLAGISLSFKL